MLKGMKYRKRISGLKQRVKNDREKKPASCGPEVITLEPFFAWIFQAPERISCFHRGLVIMYLFRLLESKIVPEIEKNY